MGEVYKQILINFFHITPIILPNMDKTTEYTLG